MSEFSDYRFCSTWDGDGEIYNQENEIVWRFRMTGLNQGQTQVGTVGLPVFVLCDAGERVLAEIRREKRFPLARFVVTENSLRRCTIWQRSIWFTKYEFSFDDKSNWKLCMPMFSVSGKAVSDAGQVVRVQARTRREWYMRFNPGLESPLFVAALTFVVRNKLQRT